jgi:prolyl-tRNA synthetase
MTHGDDDGLRLPPVIAPRQIVLIPMLRDKPEDAAVLAYCEQLASELNRLSAFGEPLRALVDKKAGRSTDKRWGWIKRGVPVICDIGARDAAGGNVSFIRRDRLRNGEKIASQVLPRGQFVEQAVALLTDIQQSLHGQARQRMQGAIRTDITTLEQLAEYFKGAKGDEDEAGEPFRGWAAVAWSRPTGDALEKAVQQLKTLKLTVRNVPLAQEPVTGRSCLFTGQPAVEIVLVGRAY